MDATYTAENVAYGNKVWELFTFWENVKHPKQLNIFL